MSACPLPQNVGGFERLACLGLGGLLLLRGLASRRASPTVLGGMFLYRGLAGNCAAYQALGLDTRSTAERATSAAVPTP